MFYFGSKTEQLTDFSSVCLLFFQIISLSLFSLSLFTYFWYCISLPLIFSMTLCLPLSFSVCNWHRISPYFLLFLFNFILSLCFYLSFCFFSLFCSVPFSDTAFRSFCHFYLFFLYLFVFLSLFLPCSLSFSLYLSTASTWRCMNVKLQCIRGKPYFILLILLISSLLFVFLFPLFLI